MPPPLTKTPDPPIYIPSTCSGDAARAVCYSKGYMAGYGRGYQRAYDDFHTNSGSNKRNGPAHNKPNSRHKLPNACETGQPKQCYEDGYRDGYDAGYVSGEIDVADA